MSNDNNTVSRQVQALQVPSGHLAVWALGQHGYLLKGGNTAIVIDPYLTNSIEERRGTSRNSTRLIPIAISPEDLNMVSYVLITHHHGDHCDPASVGPILQAVPNARVLATYTGKKLLSDSGLDADRVDVPPVDKMREYGQELSIMPIPSSHYDQERDEHGNPAYFGFIIQMNGVTVYHSGDTIIYDGMVERLKQYQYDIVCLPVNGRDWFREQQNLVGNLTYREAADLTATLGAKVLLPSHNDLFAGNRVNPAYLVDYLTNQHPGQRFHILQAGELYYYAG